MSRVSPPYNPTNPRHTCHAMVKRDSVTGVPTEQVAMCLMCQNYIYYSYEHLQMNGGLCVMCIIRRDYRSKRGERPLTKWMPSSQHSHTAPAPTVSVHLCGPLQPMPRRRCRCESSVEWVLMRCDPRSSWRFWPVVMNGDMSMGVPLFWINTWQTEHTTALRKAFEPVMDKKTDGSVTYIKVVSNADLVATQMEWSDNPDKFIACLQKHLRLCHVDTQTVVQYNSNK